MDCEPINCWPPPSPPQDIQDCDSLLVDRGSTKKLKFEGHCNGKLSKTVSCLEEAAQDQHEGNTVQAILRKHGHECNNCQGEIKPRDCASQRRKKPYSERKYSGDGELMAEVALAKWWRSVGCRTSNQRVLPVSKNPKTLLKRISRSHEGWCFLQGEVERLQLILGPSQHSGSVHASLGSFLEKLHNCDAAYHHMEKAVALQPDPEYRWLLEKMKKQLLVTRAQRLATENEPTGCLENCLPPSLEVDRRSAQNLSLSEFYSTYALKNIPVIITDLVPSMTQVPWTLEHIREVAGNNHVSVKHLVSDSAEWARLEEDKRVTVAQFIDSLDSQVGSTKKNYLFDWSLPQHCVELAQQLTIPKYFVNDFLQRTSAGSLYSNSWPSLFIAPAGLKSELHVDAFGSNFWMALFQGKKRWVFFDKQSLPFLYPDYSWSMDPVFDVDLCKPDLKTHPLLALTKPRECILYPGELLFVPAGCPHYVENLETSLAISANFVDLSNLDFVRQELNISGLVDERSADLACQFNDVQFPIKMSSRIGHLEWKEFKRWPKPEYSDYDWTTREALDETRS